MITDGLRCLRESRFWHEVSISERVPLQRVSSFLPRLLPPPNPATLRAAQLALGDFMGILVVGSVAFDAIQTPFGKVDRCLGGSATYFSVAASFFSEVDLVAVVGDDFSDEDLAIFRG